MDRIQLSTDDVRGVQVVRLEGELDKLAIERARSRLDPLVADGRLGAVRGVGALLGTVMAPGVSAMGVRLALAERGVIARPIGEEVVALCPPLVITDDDLDLGIPQTIPLTTETASAIVIDVNNNPGETIAPGANCGRPCDASATGALFDCDAMEAATGGGLSGSGLAGCFPLLDSRTLGDNVVCTVLASQ